MMLTCGWPSSTPSSTGTAISRQMQMTKRGPAVWDTAHSCTGTHIDLSTCAHLGRGWENACMYIHSYAISKSNVLASAEARAEGPREAPALAMRSL
jgi:hypothetical protein